jgi:putative inorganic carbon (HCO3(-)) transporter
VKKAIVHLPVDRRLIRVFILASFIVAEIFYGSLAAILAHNPLLAFIAVIGLIAAVVTFIAPVWGLGLFVAAMFVEGMLAVEGVGTVAKLVGILVFGAWIVRSLSGGRFRITLPPQGQFAIAFVVWGLMSAIWAMDPLLVFSRMVILVQVMALYVMVIHLVNSPRRLQLVLSIVIIASLALACLIIFRVRSGEMTRGRVETEEVSGYDPNNQAAYLLLGAAALMALFSQAVGLSRKLFFLFALSIIVLAVLATSSRGAMVALAAILAFSLLLDRRLWQLVPPALLIGGIALLSLPSTFLERLVSIVTLSDRGSGRLDIWLVGAHMISRHPLVGVGLGNFGRMFDLYFPETFGISPLVALFLPPTRGPHNIFIGVLAELGVIGFALFVAMIGLTLRSALTAVLDFKRQHDPQMTTLAMGVLLGLVGMLTASMFVDLRFRKHFWLLLALAEVVRRVPPEWKGKKLNESVGSGA